MIPTIIVLSGGSAGLCMSSRGDWPREGRIIVAYQAVADTVQAVLWGVTNTMVLTRWHQMDCPPMWTDTYCKSYSRNFWKPAILTAAVPWALVLLSYLVLYLCLRPPSTSSLSSPTSASASSSATSADDRDGKLYKRGDDGGDVLDSNAPTAGAKRVILAERYLMVVLWLHLFLLVCWIIVHSARHMWWMIILNALSCVQDCYFLYLVQLRMRVQKRLYSCIPANDRVKPRCGRCARGGACGDVNCGAGKRGGVKGGAG
jgi:hypothetical protein